MGNNPSSASGSCDNALSLHWKQLFSDLEIDEQSTTASRNATAVKDNFIGLFGGPSVELGVKLYSYFFHDQTLNMQNFIVSMETMKTKVLDSSNPLEFLLQMFFTTEITFEEDLQKLLHAAAVCGLTAGSHSEHITIAMGHPLLTALASALVPYVGGTGGCSEARFHQWLTTQCPRLLTGLTIWLKAILLPFPATSDQTLYHLPTTHHDDDTHQLGELQLLVWLLSCVLPNTYMGGGRAIQYLHVQGGATSKAPHCELPVGGVWTCLYSSSKHGFSLNRFQHQCYDYKQPSIMLVICATSAHAESHLYALAMDSEWRDGAFFYGGENFHLVQLKPTYSLLKKGAKLFSLNEKQRGFPKGFRVMGSLKHDFCLFEMDIGLDQARIREGDWMRVSYISVWGCGGVNAMETQKGVKIWEAKEVLRRRQMDRSQLRSTWKDSADCYLLEMGGVTTSRPIDHPGS